MNNETNFTILNDSIISTTADFITNLSNAQPSVFDRHTIILVAAFFFGLLSIGVVIILAICCCKGSMCKNRNSDDNQNNEKVNGDENVIEMNSLKQNLNETKFDDNNNKNDKEEDEETTNLLQNEQTINEEKPKETIVTVNEKKDPSPIEITKPAVEPINTSKKSIPTAVAEASISNSSSTVTLNSIPNSISNKSFVYNKNNNKNNSLVEVNKIDENKERRYSKHGPVQTLILKPAKSINFSDHQSKRNSRISVYSVNFERMDKELDDVVKQKLYRDEDYYSNNDLNSEMNSATDLYRKTLEHNNKSQMNSTNEIFNTMKSNEHLGMNHSKSQERLGKNSKSTTTMNSCESEKSCY